MFFLNPGGVDKKLTMIVTTHSTAPIIEHSLQYATPRELVRVCRSLFDKRCDRVAMWLLTDDRLPYYYRLCLRYVYQDLFDTLEQIRTETDLLFMNHNPDMLAVLINCRDGEIRDLFVRRHTPLYLSSIGVHDDIINNACVSGVFKRSDVIAYQREVRSC